MIRNIISAICLSVFFMVSCDEKADGIKLSDSGYLVFGHFYGMCQGERCIEIFRLEEDKLLEDTKDEYPSRNDFYVGNFVELSRQKFDKTKDLTNYFPTSLLTETDTVIGMPDAGDWGGLYVEYNFNGVRKFWVLDQMTSNVPTKYHTFIDKVNEKITQLQ